MEFFTLNAELSLIEVVAWQKNRRSVMIEAEYRLCPGRDLAGINLFLSSSGGGQFITGWRPRDCGGLRSSANLRDPQCTGVGGTLRRGLR